MSIENLSGLNFNRKHNHEKYGSNVEVLLKVMRHGERDKDGSLLDIGREITRNKAFSSGIKTDDFDAVKAIGSNAGPKGPSGVGRAAETADIYAHAISGDKKFNSRLSEPLSYENIISKTPFDWNEAYNNFLPENFTNLSDEEKMKASKLAQTKTFDRLINDPDAEDYRKETAGAVAYIMEHYQEMTRKLNSGSKVLIPAGTHGGSMEFLLQQTLIHTDKNGETRIGLDNFKDIGGEFDPSDSYNIHIRTDEDGKLRDILVTFDNPNRPQSQLLLDAQKIKELSDFYKSLHS